MRSGPRSVAGEEEEHLSGEMSPSRLQRPTAAAVAGRMQPVSQHLTDGTPVQI